MKWQSHRYSAENKFLKCPMHKYRAGVSLGASLPVFISGKPSVSAPPPRWTYQELRGFGRPMPMDYGNKHHRLLTSTTELRVHRKEAHLVVFLLRDNNEAYERRGQCTQGCISCRFSAPTDRDGPLLWEIRLARVVLLARIAIGNSPGNSKRA